MWVYFEKGPATVCRISRSLRRVKNSLREEVPGAPSKGSSFSGHRICGGVDFLLPCLPNLANTITAALLAVTRYSALIQASGLTAAGARTAPNVLAAGCFFRPHLGTTNSNKSLAVTCLMMKHCVLRLMPCLVWETTSRLIV